MQSKQQKPLSQGTVSTIIQEILDIDRQEREAEMNKHQTRMTTRCRMLKRVLGGEHR